MSGIPVVLLFDEYGFFDPEGLDPRLFNEAHVHEMRGASIWSGPLEGDGLYVRGEACQDLVAAAMVELRPQWAKFDNCLLEGEETISGGLKWQRLQLHQAAGNVLAGARQFLPLWESYRRNRLCSVLEWFRSEHGVTSIDFPGTILRSATGEPRILQLFERDPNHGWFVSWHDAREATKTHSLVLQPWVRRT